MAGGERGTGWAGGPTLWRAVAVLIGVGAALALSVSLTGTDAPVPAPTSTIDVARASHGDGPRPTSSSAPSSPSESPTTAMTGAPESTDPTVDPATPSSPSTPRPTRSPSPTPVPTAAPTEPAITAFTVPSHEDCTDETAGTITIAWSVVRATGVTVSIDGPGIFDTYPASGSADVPFACSQAQLSHTYTLVTTGGTGPAATSTKSVTARAPGITSFALGRADCPSTSGNLGITLTYEVTAATGVELKRDGAVYATYSNRMSSDGLTVDYDCSRQSQTFVLTTIGGYGTAATRQLVVDRSLP